MGGAQLTSERARIAAAPPPSMESIHRQLAELTERLEAVEGENRVLKEEVARLKLRKRSAAALLIIPSTHTMHRDM